MIIKILSSLKKRLKRLVKPLYFIVFPHKVECNICGWRDFKFYSDNWHPNTICPKCRSQIRQRLFWAAINNIKELSATELFNNKKVLHFAPDKCLRKILSRESGQYTTADLLAEGYNYENIDLNIDMSDMREIDDKEFDCVIAFDVLEHIPNHLTAIDETNRILSLGGFCIFMVPQKDHLVKTFEDLSITDPKEREEKFGQWDHWRIYGDDFKGMIEERGFTVILVNEKSMNSDLISRNVLYPPILSNHPLATNNRRVYFGQKTKHITKNKLG